MPAGKGRDLQNLRQIVKSRDAVVIVGAGFTLNVTRDSSLSWPNLVRGAFEYLKSVRPDLSSDSRRTIEAALANDSSAESLIVAAGHISEELGGNFAIWLENTFGHLIRRDDRWIEAVVELDLPIATTNIDNVIEDHTGRTAVTWQDPKLLSDYFRDKSSGIVAHLHGHYSRADSIVLGTQSYQVIGKDEAAQTLQRALYSLKTLIFVGFGLGLEDPNFGSLREQIKQLGMGYKHYRLELRGGAADKAREEHKDENIVVVEYGSTYNDLPSFLKRLRPSPRRRRAPVLSGVPDIPRYMTGRGDLVDEILGRLSTGADVALWGLPGAGKTALAAATAGSRDRSEVFPDGVLWHSAGPDPDFVLGLKRWCHALGVSTAEISRARNEVSSLRDIVRGRLDGRKFLIVMDDVWSSGAVAALSVGSRSSGCAHLVTTRSPTIALDVDPNRIKLDELARDEALALMATIAPEVMETRRSDIEGLLASLGGLPLVIGLVGARLARDFAAGNQAFQTTLSQLENVAQVLRLPVPPSFDSPESRTISELIGLSERHLSGDAVVALRRLAVFPPKTNSFGRDAAVIVTSKDNAELILLDAGLIDRCGPLGFGADRYQMHQTIRDYAIAAPADGIEVALDEAMERLTRFLAELASQRPNTPHDREAWADRIDLETLNINTCLSWAFEHQKPWLAAELCGALSEYWYESSRFDEAIRWCSRVLGELPDVPDSDANERIRGNIENSLGNAYYNQGLLNQAESHYRASLQVRSGLPGRPDVQGSLNNISLIQREKGDLGPARDTLLRALDHNEKIIRLGVANERELTKAQRWKAINLNNLGVLWRLEGDYQTAATVETECFAIFAQVGDPWGMAMAQHDLALAQIASGNASEALSNLRKSMRIRRSIGDKRGLSRGLLALSQYQLATKNVESARDMCLAAAEYSLETGDIGTQADVAWLLAHAYWRIDKDEALVLALAAEDSEAGRHVAVAKEDQELLVQLVETLSHSEVTRAREVSLMQELTGVLTTHRAKAAQSASSVVAAFVGG